MYETTEQILIFKTNIKTEADKETVTPVLNNQQHIQQWSIDMQDVDCVLRVVTPLASAPDIIELITQQGYHCSELE